MRCVLAKHPAYTDEQFVLKLARFALEQVDLKPAVAGKADQFLVEPYLPAHLKVGEIVCRSECQDVRRIKGAAHNRDPATFREIVAGLEPDGEREDVLVRFVQQGGIRLRAEVNGERAQLKVGIEQQRGRPDDVPLFAQKQRVEQPAVRAAQSRGRVVAQ